MRAREDAEAIERRRATLPCIEGRLHFAGAIQGRARFDVPDMSKTNLPCVEHPIAFRDARSIVDELSLEREGFILAKHKSPSCQLIDRDALDRGYHAEVSELLQKLVGADLVVPHRGGMLKRFSARAQEATIARATHFAHLDFTAASALDASELAMQREHGAVRPYRRFCVLQTWRALTPPPQDQYLAFCDSQTFDPADAIPYDLVIGDESQRGNSIECRVVKANPQQRWYFFSNLRDDELLVHKSFDSDMSRNVNVPHGAFDSPDPNSTPRGSIETRFTAFFD